MAITATTLSAAIAANDTVIGVASATGITAPVSTTGAGVTFLKIDSEVLGVISVSGTQVTVRRGLLGTQAKSHENAAPVLIGSPSDYPSFVPEQSVSAPQQPYNFSALGAPLTGATVAPVNGAIHFFTGTTALVTITPPAGLVAGGKITLIFSGSGSGLTWTAAENIAVAGTATTALSAVDFFYNPVTSKWYPSRLA